MLDFHELESVEFCSPTPRPLKELLPIFESLGFTLHDDIVSLDRADPIAAWQHSSIVEVHIERHGQEVYGFRKGQWDVIRLHYLFASLPFSLVERFVDVAFTLSAKLGLPVTHLGKTIDPEALTRYLDECRLDVLENTGEEAGSKGLTIRILQSYPRR